ncbi:MAG: lipoyl(octanoyl) transferase LipB [Sphingomonas sp.]|nr:lipoyl(octanoyl) transferase LipB [Sphingomonas sp.]
MGKAVASNDDIVEWRIEPTPIDYSDAMEIMTARAAAVAAGSERELVWLLEHPPIYTAGTSADPSELLISQFPVHTTGRGGRYTYHGPGQRVGYVILNLNKRGRDLRCYVHALEGWVIAALANLGVSAFRAPGRIGIWTDDHGAESKIGAIGIRVKQWVTMHGFAVNIAPDLTHFAGIVPCGINEFGVTSLERLEKGKEFGAFDTALAAEFDGFLTSLSFRG